jgi:hypothetical protein
MPRPPKTPPQSDLDGVHEDRVDNVDAAIAAGQDAGDLARAHEEAAGKPGYSREESRDDRSR